MYALCMEKRTTIQLEHNTMLKLKALKDRKKMTYDEVVNRLLVLRLKLREKRENDRLQSRDSD